MTDGQRSTGGKRTTPCLMALAVWSFLAVGPARAESLTITTLAGPVEPAGAVDGSGFNPYGVAVDRAGNLYVADCNNHTIVKITPAGVVSTLAGLAGKVGSPDGTGTAARFDCPEGVAVDGSGNVYVADTYNHTIRKITSDGVVTTLAGLAGLAGSAGSADGTGSAARFNWPSGVAVDGSGNVYVADTGKNTIRKITTGGVVSTLAGTAGRSGSADGTGSAARFDNPYGVAVDGSSIVYVADTYNNTIRKGSPSMIADVATIDQASGVAGATRLLDTNPQTAVAWQWSEIRVPPGSTAALSSTTVRNPTFTPDVLGLYVFRLVATDAAGNQSITTVQLTVRPLNPGGELDVFVWVSLRKSVHIAWGNGTTGKTAGDVTALDWTVQDSTDGQVSRNAACVSSEAPNNLAMNLENTSNTGSKARGQCGRDLQWRLDHRQHAGYGHLRHPSPIDRQFPGDVDPLRPGVDRHPQTRPWHGPGPGFGLDSNDTPGRYT